eukprot:scaffold112174_cov28-Attheya_sp.AAC.1
MGQGTFVRHELSRSRFQKHHINFPARNAHSISFRDLLIVWSIVVVVVLEGIVILGACQVFENVCPPLITTTPPSQLRSGSGL